MTTASRLSGEPEVEAARAQKIIESMSGYAWSADAAGRFTYVSPNALTFLGNTSEDLNHSEAEHEFGWRRVVHPDDYERVAARWRHCLRTGDHYDTEHRLRRADGVYRWFRNSGRPSRDSQGRITQWYGTTIDIEDQRQAEAALRDRERELSQLVDMVPSHLWRLTPDGEPTFFNRRMVDFLGLDVSDTDKPGMSRLEAVIETVHPDDAPEFRAALHRSLNSGGRFSMRYRLRRADGVYRWMSSRAEPLRDQDGRIAQWYGLCHDIDDQVKAEEALRDRERELSQIVDMVPVHIRRLTPKGEPIFFNKRLIDFFGLDLADLDKPGMARLPTVIHSLVHPDDAPSLLETVRHSVATGEPYSMKYRLRRADGMYRWVDGRAEPVRDQSGAIVQWYAISIDIDDEVRAQDALRDRERELSQIVDMTPSHVWRLTPEGEPSFINKRLSDFLGLDVADYDKTDMSRLSGAILTSAHPEDAPGIVEAIGHSLATGEPFAMRWRVRRADGVYRWVDSRAEPLRDAADVITHWYGVNIDIDDQVLAQEALRERERELSQLVDMVPSLLWRLNPDGEPIFFNKRMIDFFGLDVADADKPGLTRLAAIIEAAVHPDDAAGLGEALNNSFVTGESFSMKYRLRRADGVYRWVDGRAEPLRDHGGRIVQWYGLSHDIDDQLRAEDALRESEQQLRRLVDALPTQIWAATAEGEPSYLNRRLAEYVGVTLNDLDVPDASRLQMAIQNSVHPDDAPSVGRALAHSFSTGDLFSMKYRQRRADGVYRWINGRAEPLRDASGRILQWYGVSFDIDDDVRTQEELRRTQERLAVASQAAGLAELSASIAHEVNQPLAAIVANSHACHRWLSAETPNLDRAKVTAERIIRDANAAADVVSQIRALFKHSEETRTSVAPGSVVAEARDLMAEEAARRRVRMDVEVESNLPSVALDRVQMQQVLINLLRNGMEAIDPVATDRMVRTRVRRLGDVVQMEISDSGPGVEFPERTFEPFFTTKGHGMGMGLAICRSIVESHGGRLWAERNEPRGATFIFTLPVEVKATP